MEINVSASPVSSEISENVYRITAPLKNAERPQNSSTNHDKKIKIEPPMLCENTELPKVKVHVH